MPHCGNQMRHLAVIEDTAVDRVDSLSPGGVGPVPATTHHLRVPPVGQEWPKYSQIPLTYHLVPGIA